MAKQPADTWIGVSVDPTRMRYTFDSPLVGDRLEVTVAPPPAYQRSALPLPVLYVLDPFLTLEIVSGLSRLFGWFSGGHVPPMLVVGVGYPTTELRQWMALRSRDLTPTSQGFPPTLPINPPYGLGGAARLLRSITAEIIPGIEARYHVHPADRTLIGYSLSGLFGLYVLFHVPETFTRYLLVSPSIWWDEAVTFTYERAWADHHDDLPARVFLAVGEGEEQEGRGWLNENMPDEALPSLRQVHNLRLLVDRLKSRGYPNLSIDGVVFPGEYHLTVFPAALGRGLVQLFTDDAG